jgi:hypothetical protein
MKLKHTIIASVGLIVASSALTAQSVVIFFENDVSPSVTGGDLVITTAGSGGTDSFASDRFDGLTTSTFEIQNIPTFGTLTITATATDNLNTTNSGLGDGTSGFNTTGESISFTFDQAVTITYMDFATFTSSGSDSVVLFSGASSLGTYQDGTITTSADFSDTNAVTANISIAAGSSFRLYYDAGAFQFEELGFTVVPEPSAYALFAGMLTLGFVASRRRSLRQ